MSPRLLSFLVAAAFIAVIAVVVRTFRGWDLVRGEDGRPSTSKAQWWIWTALAIFGYVAVFVERWLRGNPGEIVEVPENLLLAMGFSAATMVVAKGVTASYAAQRLVDKRATPAALGGLFTDDSGAPDLTKIQMLAFTAIAAFVYLVRLATQGDATSLPVLIDIDPALMILMGLSQGGYLGQKVAARGPAPQVQS